MQNEKVGFFQKVMMSIKDFEKYIIFATEKISDTLKYLLKIMLIFSAVISIGFTYFLYKNVQEGIKYFNKNIKAIEYQNNELSVNNNEPLVIEKDDFVIQYIVIDTSELESEYIYNERAELYNTAIIVLKDKVLVKNIINNSGMVVYSYEDIASIYDIGDFDKQQTLEAINNINNMYLYLGVYVSIFVYMFLVYTISSLFDILLLTMVGYIIGRISRIKLKLNAAFSIGVHALTLPLILNMLYIIVNLFTGFTIKYFGWMYTTISYIYVVVAILMIKTDIINTQIELIKIVKEQEKVREELKQKEEDKQSKDKEEENNNKDDERSQSKEEPNNSEA